MELSVLKSDLDTVNSDTVPYEHSHTDSRITLCWQTVQLFAGRTQINKSHQTEADLDFSEVHPRDQNHGSEILCPGAAASSPVQIHPFTDAWETLNHVLPQNAYHQILARYEYMDPALHLNEELTHLESQLVRITPQTHKQAGSTLVLHKL